MSDAANEARRMSDEERIAKVQTEKRRERYQLAMLSVIGILVFHGIKYHLTLLVFQKW